MRGNEHRCLCHQIHCLVPQIQLLRSPCVSLTVGPGLSSQHLVQICTLTGLTYLKLRFAETDQEWMVKSMLMDSLTKLQLLNEFNLSFSLRLPLLLSKLASLQSLTVGPGLSSQHLLQIYTLSGLTYLKLRFHKPDPERTWNRMPMDSLTELHMLKELKLSFPPRLPLWLSKLANLQSLTVAPKTAAILDMSAFTQVSSLRLGQGYRIQTRIPVVLPTGPKARLLALAIHTLCDFQHEANHLTELEDQPGLASCMLSAGQLLCCTFTVLPCARMLTATHCLITICHLLCCLLMLCRLIAICCLMSGSITHS